MLQTSREFAIQAHSHQKYGSQPYVAHLDAVVSHLINYGEEAQIVGYLHDVIEDTDIQYNDIKNSFNTFIADCVSSISDEAGNNRKERKQKTYAKLKAISGKLEVVLIVKAADRLANLQACVQDNNAKLFSMYQKEHPDFYSAVYREGLCDDIWEEIELILAA